jgi:hypothetical protein
LIMGTGKLIGFFNLLLLLVNLNVM